MTLGKTVGKALVWTSLESFALSGLSLISLVIFARLLSAAEFGVVAVALAIVQILSIPVELMFQDALIQRAELQPIHTDSAFTVSALLGIALCVTCWLSADLAERILHTPHLSEVLRWMSFSLVGSGFGGVLVAIQRRRLEFRSLALRSMIGRGGSAVISIGLAFAGAGMWSLVAQQVLLVCLSSLILWLLSDQRPRLRFSWVPTRELLRFGLFTTLFLLLGVLTTRIYTVLVGAYLGSESAGLLNIAFRGLDMFRELLMQAVRQIAMPLFARLRESGELLFDAYTKSVQLTTLVSYPIFVGLAVCSEEVLQITFGPQWLAAAPYFSVIALLCLPAFLRMYGPTLVQACGRPDIVSWEIAAQAVFVIVGMITLGHYSAANVLFVWSARLLVSIPIEMWVLRHVTALGYWRQLRGSLVPSLGAAAMGSAVWFTKRYFVDGLSPGLRMSSLALVGLVVYCGTVLLLDRTLLTQLHGFVPDRLRRNRA